MKLFLAKLLKTTKVLLQQLIITMNLYSGNGLANHAAAGAYGFFLSLAPMLLLFAFFILTAFNSLPVIIDALLNSTSILDIIIDEQWLTKNFLAVTKPGISGVISIISVFWAGRIFALSIQRGLRIIFKGTKTWNPVKNTLITFAIQIAVLLFIIILFLGSQTTLYLIRFFISLPETSVAYFFISNFSNRLFLIAMLGAVSFFAYLFIPLHSVRKFSAFRGALFCALGYGCVDLVLHFILSHARYNLLYGTLGNLMILLVNVYFFFIFFFIGAQLAYVIDSFDVLYFLKMRRIRLHKKSISCGPASDAAKIPGYLYLMDKMFSSNEGNLGKYSRCYKKNEIILNQGDTGNEIYYIVHGEAEVLLPSSQSNGISADVLYADSFFGEIGYLLSEERCATVVAKTDVSVLVLPPLLFEAIINYDTGFDIDIIEDMSRRLKNTTEKFAALNRDSTL